MKAFSSVLFAAMAGAALSAVVAGCAPTMSNPAEYADRPISAEAGFEYFSKTGGGDPYATGMAYPVFLALMDLFPEELGKSFPEFEEKFGFYPPPDAKGDPHAVPVGFHLTTDPNSSVSWLVGNCTICHTERLRLPQGDLMVLGLGNKHVRPHDYQNALIRIGLSPRLDEDAVLAAATTRASAQNLNWAPVMRAPIVHASVMGLRSYARQRRSELNMWKDAVPGRMGTIESFALAVNRYQKEQIHLAQDVGWAKVPDVRSVPFRDTLSYDASGFGSPQALVLEADFLLGARPEWYVSHPHIATSMYLYLKGFTRKLPYPASIDKELAARGKGAFEASCASCHGHYVDHEGEMRVSYKERVIPKEIVGTDPARVDAVTPSFVSVSNSIPLTQGYTAVHNTGGYVPPVLLDVWARGVLGHAGQWPSIAAMAQPEGERPQTFIVDVDGEYDLTRLGVRYEASAERPLRKGEYFYDGRKPGYRVSGHTFLSALPADDRRAVIEYLKTL
jgi:hypothetical protein